MAPTDPLVADIVAKLRERQPKAQHPKQIEDEPISVYPDRIEVEQGREAGTVHVGDELLDGKLFWHGKISSVRIMV